MSRLRVFQAKPGPWFHLVRFLLLSSFLSTSPVLSQGDMAQWKEKSTVKSSWCSGTQADQTTTYEPPLKYSYYDFSGGVLGSRSVQNSYVTEKSVANWTLADTTVAVDNIVNITEQDFTPCQDETRLPIYIRHAANITVNISSLPEEDVDMCLVLEAPEIMVFKLQNNRVGVFNRTACFRVNADNEANVEDKFSICNLTSHFDFKLYRADSMRHIYTSKASVTAEVEVVSQVNFGAFCYSYKKGYIQVPTDWDGLSTTYLPSTTSCITLEVPGNHLIMTSVAGILLEGSKSGDCRFDTLTIHMKAVCQGPGKTICEHKDYSPTVYDDHQRIISFRFSSDSVVQTPGFRILYSFHSTYAKPEKLPGGKWNCSVPYYSDFQDHFLCSEEVFCQDGRDGQMCITPAICARRKGVAIDYGPGQCFRVFSHLPEEYSWVDAEATCKIFGSRLIHLDSTAKWEFFLNVTKTLTEDVFVGSKQAPSTDPEMYHWTWRWSNDTLAILGNVNSSTVREGCGVIKRSNRRVMSAVDCTRDRIVAAFICERLFPGLVPYDNSTDAASLLPALQTETAAVFPIDVRSRRGLLMAKCHHNHTAHAFMACDVATNCSAAAGQVLRCASDSRFSPAVPFFKCDIGSQFVPYSLVCDHRVDCWDASDERFCQFRPCPPPYRWTCKDKKQCISAVYHCDGVSNCIDGSDEVKCSRTKKIMIRNITVPPSALVNFIGNGVVTAISSTSCPETHFRCPGNGYCMPVYVLCNGVFDCPGKEDEMGCDLFTCPGFYRCRNSRVCVHHENLCDRVYHCPEHDDELFCFMWCPENCTCYGSAYICTGAVTPKLYQEMSFRGLPGAGVRRRYQELRYVEASGTGMTFADIDIDGLIHLSLRHNNITIIGTGNNLPNLQNLDLSYNQLTAVTGAELSEMNNLRYLSLAYNPLILDHLLDGSHVLPNIYELNFAGLDIPQLTEIFFAMFPNLRVLNVSNSGLNELPQTGFQTLKQLRTLDLSGCSLQKISHGIFDGLEQLDRIVSDDYKLCCPSVLPVGFDSKNCLAPADEVSSCDALLRSDAFRVFLLAYSVLSLVGNLGSFVYKNFIEKSTVRMGFDVFVTHLNISDFLMGIYLAIVGVADRIYYGDYIWNDVTWRHSAACKVAGFLSYLSSEMSAFLVCLITLERFLVIRFPFSRVRFSRTSAHVTCVALWIISFVLSAVPLLPTMEHWEFYSQSGICVPLPITRKEFPGQDYSFSVMIGLNFVLFVVIAVGQGLIYSSIRSSARACRSSSNSKDMAVAHRLLAVVMTDFLCWFPIGLLGIMAKSGLPIPGDVNVGMAIFVLPFNSALNPFLYTFNMVMERRRKAQRKAQRDRWAKEQREIVSQSATASPGDPGNGSKRTWTESEAWLVFGEMLDAEVLSVEVMIKMRQRLSNRV